MDEPQPGPASLTPPEWLTAEGSEVWGELAPKLHAEGLLTELDTELFAQACAQLAVARRSLGMEGRQALAIADRILARFGMTPSDRTKVSVKKAVADPLGDFLSKAR